ncbi:bifunctional 2-polyprenyl-6-hydroxyphenol methylase/3-demethylubiquinol 3-O-methyltransferase UbiG [Pleionea sp. CnH1-48]|uniref:class I SAM-dependent methyltransferase n=1 Tax=Pleionea sp. CnH1-48 TaxID=2954494 RepID=UPI002096B51E|nr:class I SAM-dependent methyltransferase [Pleionea sp. CnH1-48]MCO7223974.1 class I SAM-dependent methyltransferase [Pleionea sp. CnH1-48]
MNEENKQSLNTDIDYIGKYEQSGKIGTWLIDNFYQHIDELIKIAAPLSCLEVGCGEGISTQKIHRSLKSESFFEACELEPRLVESAQRRNPSIQVKQDSVYNLHYEDNQFDLVVCLEVLEHLDDFSKALEELSRVSARWVLTSVPREPLWCFLNLCRLKYVSHLGNTPGHLNHWSTSGFKRLLSRYGKINAARTPIPWSIVLWEVNPPTND